MTELKPCPANDLRACPFCGKAPQETPRPYRTGALPGSECYHRIECLNCSESDEDISILCYDMGATPLEAKERAKAAWNHRPLEDALSARVKELEAERDEARELLADHAPYTDMLRTILNAALEDRNRRLAQLDEARAAAVRGVAMARKLAEKHYDIANKVNDAWSPSNMCTACNICTGEEDAEGYTCEDAILEWAEAEVDLPEES